MPSNEFFEALSRSVMWKSKPLAPASWRRVWKKESWVRDRFGPISRAFQADPTEASATYLSQASLASRSRVQGGKGEIRTPGTSGRTSAGLSTGRGRVSSFLKTSQACSPRKRRRGEPPTPLSDLNWNGWLTQFRKCSLQRRKLGLRISGNGCLSSGWQTPKVATGTYSYSGGDKAKPFNNLEGQATKRDWPTASAHDGRRPGSDATSTQGRNLKREAELWSTPNVPNGGRTQSAEHIESRGQTAKGKRQVGLHNEASLWAWPTTRDHKDGSNPSEAVPTNGLLGRQAPRMMQDGKPSSLEAPTLRQRLRLNPLFVEWLMGWPLGWTDFARVEMGLSQPKPSMPCDSSLQAMVA